MNDDCLKLTTYFGELDRGERGLLADELLEVYGEHRLQASVLLRGAEGFGNHHQLHTDRLLTLSENPPTVAVALDTRARIESVLELVAQLQPRGLITLERARLLHGDIGSVELPERLGEATKLTVYVGRRQRAGATPAFVAVCDLLHERGIAGATVLLGVDGTTRGRRARARLWGRNGDVPLVIVAVGSSERIGQLLPELGGLLDEPLLTLERIQLCKRDGELLARPHALLGVDEHGLALWQKLTVYTSQSATHDGRPLAPEIMRRLRESQASGATSLRGIWGFHGDHAPHGDSLLAIRRHVPVVTIAIDTPARIARSFEIIDELTTEQGLVTSEMVPALAAIGEHARWGGLRLARHDG